MPKDSAGQLAFDLSAPPPERTDALAEVMQTYQPASSDVREAIEFIRQDLEDQDLAKALAKPNVVPFPPRRQQKERGMQSVDVDEFQVLINGDYIEVPGALNFDSMRAMVEQTPILSAVLMTRMRQVQRFCRVQESGVGPGFCIRHVDRDHQLTDTEHESVQLLQRFFDNCGWEFNPRRRRQLRRDSFSQFMVKLTRDTLTMDSTPIETEFKRDIRLGVDGLYAVDGATIRLCSEEGYRGDDEIFALQVVSGQIRTAYTFQDMIYEPRNPRSDVLAAGYGMGEVELLVRTVTGYLNALTYNSKYFDSNSIPKGVLHFSGNYAETDVTAMKRYWNSMVKGVNNAWMLPILFSKDQESKASFEKFGVDQNEMMFARWMTFLTAIICAIYGMDPAEINSDSFSAGTSSLSGNDTEERLAASKDKGLRPLLSYFENLFTDYVVREFDDKYVFRWTGLDEDDDEKRHEMRKLVLTVDEARAQEGYDEHPDKDIGNAPLNPTLTGLYMQKLQAQQEPQGEEEDFGQAPEGQGEAQEQGGEAEGGDGGEAEGSAPGNPGKAAPGAPAEPTPAAGGDFGRGDNLDFGKALADAEKFGLPVLRIGDLEE